MAFIDRIRPDLKNTRVGWKGIFSKRVVDDKQEVNGCKSPPPPVRWLGAYSASKLFFFRGVSQFVDNGFACGAGTITT
jgi:hypothetical protein